MKKIFMIAIAAAMGLTASAQEALNVEVGGLTYNFNSEYTGLMPFSNSGRTLTIQGMEFEITSSTRMYVGNTVVSDNTVEVTYADTGATVMVAGNIARYVTAEIDGAHVTLVQSDEVGDSTGEITYVLSGESADGSLTLEGSYKSTVELRGLALTNPSGAAIDIQNGKRIELSSKNGTVNTLKDGSGSQKAALYCKGHLELKGKGTLNVTGTVGHAIAAKEYMEMKNCTVNILGAPKDGISCTQYFLMESGELVISGTDGDGIQVDFDKADASKRDEEDTGSITIAGGTIDITLAGVASKGLKAEGDCLISGGEITIRNSGAGEWDSAKSKTKASACIGIDGDVTITGGKLSLTATGGGGKGISCDGTFTMEDGNLSISTEGGVLAYVNGQLSQNYTGNTDRLDSDAKSSPKGVKADTEVVINGGTIYVKTIGNNGEGIESKGILTVNGGDITIRAKDDGINSSSHMYIKGGNIDVIATNNDGLDANGSIYIEGGVIRAFGGASPECGIDANDEQGYTVIITGGYLLAVGGSNSYPRTSASTQPYVTTSGSVTGGSEISISGNGVDYAFTVPEDYTKPSGGNMGGWGPGGGNSGNMTVMISVPGMTTGQSYTVNNGGTSSSATARLTGSSGGGRW